jgi:hypothetical protein
MQKARKIKFIVHVKEWFDKANGNSYFSARITKTNNSDTLTVPFAYGYGDHSRFVAIEAMAGAGWIPAKYKKDPYAYEREKNYPIHFIKEETKQAECKAWGLED